MSDQDDPEAPFRAMVDAFFPNEASIRRKAIQECLAIAEDSYDVEECTARIRALLEKT